MIKEKRFQKMRKRGRSALALLLVVLVTISMLNIPELTDVRAESESETTTETTTGGTTTSGTTTETKVEPQEGQQSEPQEGQQSEPQEGQQSEPQEGQQSEPQEGQQAEPNSGQQTEPTESTEPIEPTKPTEPIEKTEIPETTTKIITAWQWTGSEDELNIQKDEVTGVWGIGISVGNVDTKVDFETVISLLPASITATIQNEKQNQEEQEEQEENEELTGEIALIWSCETYVQDETGKWPVSGDYIFEAGLPEGYSLADGNEKMEVVVQLGGAVVYAEGDNAGSYNVTGETSGDDWVYDAENNSLTIQKSGTYTITGDSSTATKERIMVGDNLTVTLTVKDVNCVMPVGSYNSGLAAMSISGTSTVTLILKGDNVFNSGYNHAGVEFSNAQDGSLTIQGDGKLTAAGGFSGAGIGGGYQESGINITISGGTVDVTGGDFGAGIGGGYSRSGTNITISGGTVDATGGKYGAGIGGGASGSGSDIKISGGTVTAKGGDSGAGIGGGASESGTNITISSGTVDATGGKYGAGIGGGGYGSGSDIKISGGTVTAKGGDSGAGIGGGESKSGTNITISSGTVDATGGDAGAGIGGGASERGTNITISSGTVTATGGEYGAGIGGGDWGSGSDIKIKGGTVTATGGDYGAGIGGGDSGSGSDIKIKGGSVKGVGGYYGSAIGATPTNGADNVYLFIVDMEDISNINSIGIDGNDWTRNGNHPNGDKTFDGKFYLYLTGENHLITVSGKNYLVKWDSNTSTFKRSESEYKGKIASIPSISVSSTTDTITVSISDYNANYDPEYGVAQYACIETGSTLKEWKSSAEPTAQSTYTFKNLTSGTSYTCYARYAGTETCYKSGYASTVCRTILEASVVTINYIDEKVTFEDIYEVNTSSDFTGTKIASKGSISDYIPAYGGDSRTLYVRVKAVPDGAGASESVAVPIPARPETPNAVVTTTASTITVQKNDNWEYSRDEENWTAWSNAYEVTQLGAGQTQKFYVRVKATASTFASAVQTINATTNQASYTVTIPSDMKELKKDEPIDAGNISITEDTTHPFDLGYNGKIKVSVSDGVDADGNLTLIRKGDEETTIASSLYADKKLCKLNDLLITYTETNKTTSIPLTLSAPVYGSSGAEIPAGDYSGKVTFLIEYTELEQ